MGCNSKAKSLLDAVSQFDKLSMVPVLLAISGDVLISGRGFLAKILRTLSGILDTPFIKSWLWPLLIVAAKYVVVTKL